ncbi:MAG: type II toxin-antitoxin system prevent-host-death family antitoxin [Polyangia bacterium]|nr:type II toxin-antitoxin system prevent-host-death family antitoxin [Polyangia bacterium]
MFESKTKLSELVQRVLAGERFYITRRGKRVALLGPVEEEKRPLVRGSARNPGYQMSEDFTSSIDDFEDYP